MQAVPCEGDGCSIARITRSTRIITTIRSKSTHIRIHVFKLTWGRNLLGVGLGMDLRNASLITESGIMAFILTTKPPFVTGHFRSTFLHSTELHCASPCYISQPPPRFR
jgi:hypothetical protein